LQSKCDIPKNQLWPSSNGKIHSDFHINIMCLYSIKHVHVLGGFIQMTSHAVHYESKLNFINKAQYTPPNITFHSDFRLFQNSLHFI